jgi:hypothetical protein
MREPAEPGFGRASLRELVVNGCYRMYLMDVHEFVPAMPGLQPFLMEPADASSFLKNRVRPWF